MNSTVSKPLVESLANAERPANTYIRGSSIASSQRMMALDAARFLAAVGVVWIHVPRSEELLPSSILGRFAVPFFTAAAILFVVMGVAKRPSQSLGQFLISKIQRLYLPFLAWSGLYLGFKLLKYLLIPSEPNDFPGIELIWLGGAYHLWFIPFLISVSTCAFLVAKLVFRLPHTELKKESSSKPERRYYAMALVLGTILAMMPAPWSTETESLVSSGSPAVYMWEALPSVCWGFALAFTAKSVQPSTSISGRRPMAALGLMVVVMLALFSLGRNSLLENYAGLLLLVAALESRSNWLTNLVAKAGPYALGIYFSHLMVLKIMESAASKLHWPVSWSLDLSCFVIAVVASLGLSMVLAKYKATRWLVV